LGGSLASLGGDSSISAIVSSQAQAPSSGVHPMMTMHAPPPTIIMMTQPAPAPAPAVVPAQPKGPVEAAPTLAIGPVIGNTGATGAAAPVPVTVPPPTGQPVSDIKTIKIDVPM